MILLQALMKNWRQPPQGGDLGDSWEIGYVTAANVRGEDEG